LLDYVAEGTPNFGQSHRLPLLFCPKYPQLQTNLSCSISVLSEVTPSSDKTIGFHFCFVRSTPNFRQNHWLPPLFCPKYPQLQTKSLASTSVLSKVTPTSDKIIGFHFCFVRSNPNFGQNHRLPPLFCPKYPQLR
jgi:hypothetical protein